MYLIYVDESGDTGTTNSQTNYFVLSAIVIHESIWLNLLNEFINFRRDLNTRYGLRLNDEIHASVFLNGRLNLRTPIKRNDRIDILKQCLKWVNGRSSISIVSVRYDKSKGGDVFNKTWGVLFQRIENTLKHKNFPGGFGSDTAIIIPDNTDGGKLTKLLRKMRRYNPVPNNQNYGYGYRDMNILGVVEDPVLRDSAHSLFNQLADVVVYFCRQYYEPNRYVRKKGARTFYKFLSNVVNQYATSSNTTFNKVVEI